MSAITSTSLGPRAGAHREYQVMLGLITPLLVAGVALRRLGLLPAELVPAEPARPASFLAAVRRRAAAVIPFAFMG